MNIKRSFIITTLFLLTCLQTREALAYHFGTDPLNDVVSAAKNNNACPQHLKTEQLVALMLSPTWWEVADQNANNTPSPMTLGRRDNGNSLYLPDQWMAGAPYRRAFWHPGIGVWELDDRFKGINLSTEKFNTGESAPVVARDMSTTYCNHYNKDETIPLYWVFSPYCACASDRACNKYHQHNPDTANCNYTYYRILNGASVTSDPLHPTDSYGGGKPDSCHFAGMPGLSFPCILVDPEHNAEGDISWTKSPPPDPTNANPPLALPFYVFYQLDRSNNIQYEWRYWMLEDTSYGQDFAARREYGVGSSDQLQWFPPGPSSAPITNLRSSKYGLCDETIGKGDCGDVGLSVSLAAAPANGPAPLNGVTLTANVTGVPNETINYTFYCDRSDSGTDIRLGWIWKHDGLSRTQVRLPAICSYPSARTYTAKVIVEQGNGAAESRVSITVGSNISCFPLTLTVNNPNGGSTPSASPGASSGCAPGQYVSGETIGLTAAPASGWMVGSWVGTQNDQSTSSTNSLTMPASSHTVTVNYVSKTPSPITIVTTSLPDAPPNQPYSVQLAASGGTGIGYTWSLADGSLPVGLNLNAVTGIISGTPTQAGTLSQFTIGVRDSGGNSTIRRFSLYVLPASGLTILSNGPSNFVFYVGTPYASSNSLTYLATGGQAPYSWTATGLPPGLQIDAAGGFLYGTPTQTGSYQAEITATDTTGETGSLSTVITVGKTAIIITDSSGHTPPSPPPAQVGTSYQFFFNAAGGSQSGYTWSISQGNLPPGLTSQNGLGCPTYCSLEVTGTPTIAGTYTFTVAVTDSLNDHGSQVATIVVNSGTPPSIATTQLPTATIGASYSTALSAIGGTPPYRWSFVGTSPDPGIQISQDGTLAGITQNTNDCPTGSSDHLGGIWVGAGYPSTYFQVIVTDAAGQSSAKQLCLVSYYPRPQVSSDSPPSITIDGQNHTITLNGSNFRSTSYIVTNGGGTLPSTYIGPNALSVSFYSVGSGPLCANPNGSSCYDAQTLPEWVIEPYSNISLSSANLAIYNPPPTLTSVAAVLDNTNQPCTANQLCQLIVTGSGFSFRGDTNMLIVEANQSLSMATYPSGPPPWTQFITGAFSLPSGTYTLQVTNTHQAGGSDATVSATFHVN